MVKYKTDQDKKLNIESQKDSNIQAKLIIHFENNAKGSYILSRENCITMRSAQFIQNMGMSVVTRKF